MSLDSKDEMKQVHIFVSGLVQGVSFRYYVVCNSQELGVSGWVKNTSDGGVEIVVQGKDKLLEEFIARCYRGSSASQVEKVEVVWERITRQYDNFQIVH